MLLFCKNQVLKSRAWGEKPNDIQNLPLWELEVVRTVLRPLPLSRDHVPRALGLPNSIASWFLLGAGTLRIAEGSRGLLGSNSQLQFL